MADSSEFAEDMTEDMADELRRALAVRAVHHRVLVT